ncbi:MAG: hemerythrin domain-containing protein [Polyangiales bacterium]
MPNPVHDIASKALGTVKATKARLEGLHGVFRKLAQEHGEASALLMRLKHSKDPALRRELFPRIRQELLAHEKSELQVVFPILREHTDTQQIAADHHQDALELEQLIDQLSHMSTDDAAWQTTFDSLVDRVQQHVHEEESDFFPTAQRVLGDGVADALLPRYEAAKRELWPQLS